MTPILPPRYEDAEFANNSYWKIRGLQNTHQDFVREEMPVVAYDSSSISTEILETWKRFYEWCDQQEEIQKQEKIAKNKATTNRKKENLETEFSLP